MACGYRGPLSVWNYGFWNEWTVRNERPEELYTRESETSEGVLRDVQQGRLFSNSSFNWLKWREFRDSQGITPAQTRGIQEAHERIRELYRARGLEIKTLDDA